MNSSNSIYAEIESSILELCSEDWYGAWELWWNVEIKNAETLRVFADIINNLVSSQRIISVEKGVDNEFSPVPFSPGRLQNEISAERPDPDHFYWFGVK